MFPFNKLSSLSLRKKNQNAQYYFALNIHPKYLQAALWGIVNKKLEVLSVVQSSYKEDELGKVANLCIDEVLGEFESEPSKILFGVPDFWLQDGDLKQENLKTLKSLCKELDLSPLAYVSTFFSISHHHSLSSGVPLTAILVNLTQPVAVSVIKGGKILGVENLEKHENLSIEVEKALMHFPDIEVMPSKFLIFSGVLKEEKVNRLKQELQGHSWMNNLPFLHLPKIEILKPSIEIEALCFAGASELEPDLKFSELNLLLNNLESEEKISESVLRKVDFQEEDKEGKSNLGDLGFMEGDIGEDQDTKEESKENLSEQINDEDDTYMLEGDVNLPVSRSNYSMEDDNLVEREKPSNLEKIFHGKRIPGLFLNKFILVTFSLVFLAIGLYIFLPKAKVTIFVDPKILQKETEVIADPSINTVDEANKKIPAKIVETDVSGTEKGVATGRKMIGDPSRGKVIIYNKTNNSKTFSLGTQLSGPNSINYSLDTSVTIASQSAVDGGISFGKATSQVTSTTIGPEGNLPAGKELTIKGETSSNFSAKVDQDVSGGTSKEVTVVTLDDQKKLLANASSSLKKKAKDDISGKLSPGLKVLEESLQETLNKNVYSKQVNDQGSDFTLSISAHYKGTAYNDSDLKTIVSKLVETNVPDGFILNLQDTETQAEVIKLEKDNKLIFKAQFKAKLFPKLDLEKLKKEITGKSPSQVAEIVRKNETVVSSEVKTSLLLPAALIRLPFLPQNISIEVLPK